MKTRIALLPHKHIRFAGSLIGMAGYVRQFIGESPTSVDGLWAKIQAEDKQNKIFSLDFTQLIYALDILLCIKEIKVDSNGLIYKITTFGNDNETNQAVM